jgi:hypothetical protein
LASIVYEEREIVRRAKTLTLGRDRRTFDLSAPKVRTGEDECSGKCGIRVGMFLGRLSFERGAWCMVRGAFSSRNPPWRF